MKMTDIPCKQRKIKKLENNINHHINQILDIEISLETVPETVLEIPKIETENQQEYPMERVDLETIQLIYQMIEQENIEVILDRNPPNIVNSVIKMGIF